MAHLTLYWGRLGNTCGAQPTTISLVPRHVRHSPQHTDWLHNPGLNASNLHEWESSSQLHKTFCPSKNLPKRLSWFICAYMCASLQGWGPLLHLHNITQTRPGRMPSSVVTVHVAFAFSLSETG